MVVPTGHPIYGTSFVALQANWVIVHLGSVIGGQSVEGHSYVAIVPFLTNYIATFNYETADHKYTFFQYSGPPLNVFVGTINQYGSIFVDYNLFGTAFGLAGIPLSMNYHQISNVSITRVPIIDVSRIVWEFPSLPAYIVKDPLIARHDPYVRVGTEYIMAWATLSDAPKEYYDELMTAKDYIGMELIELPTSWASGSIHFWPLYWQSIEGIGPVYRGTTFVGRLWFWACGRKAFHLFDDSRYEYFDPIIKPGGKVLAAGLFKVGSVGVQATAERHKYPQPGDPYWFRIYTMNPAGFNVIEWFDVHAFAVGYYYRRNGSHIFEISYGAVIPPCYTIDYVGSKVLYSIWLATNIPSGSVLIFQSILAFPSIIQFHPQSFSNLLSVLTDWLYYLANKDRYYFVSDISDPLVFTPEETRDESKAWFTACNLRSFWPFEASETEVEDGWQVSFSYESLDTYRLNAIYHKRSDGPVNFLGLEPPNLSPLSGGLRWLVPYVSMIDPFTMTDTDEDPWVFENLFIWLGNLPRTITHPLPPHTLPNNRFVDIEEPHKFFYEDVFVLTDDAHRAIPITLIGSQVVKTWEGQGDYIIRIDSWDYPFAYRPAFSGSWLLPTPVLHEHDPYNILPYLHRYIERRFKHEVAHSNFLSDVHIRIKTSVNREFISGVLTKPVLFVEKRTGVDPFSGVGGIWPNYWVIPVVADSRAINEGMWFHPSIEHWAPKKFASYQVIGQAKIPVVIGRTGCDIPPNGWFFRYYDVYINPIVPLVADPHETYRFVRPFWPSELIADAIEWFLDNLVPGLPGTGTRMPENITEHEFSGQPAPFHAHGQQQWSTIGIHGLAQPAPAPFISGGVKVIGLGSLYKWAVSEELAMPKWFERYMSRNGEDGDHFISGKFSAIIVYASYWPWRPSYLYSYVWNYRGTNPFSHIIVATSIYGVFNEEFRFGTILWRPPLADDYPWLGNSYNRWFSFSDNRARLLFPNRGWVEELPAGRTVRIPDPLEVLALFGTATYLDREAILVKAVVTLGNTSVILLPRHARYDALGLTVPYFTQDGGKCPLWMGEPIIGVDGIPFDDGRVVVYVYSVRGVYSFVLTPAGVEDWTFEPVPKWYWKLLTGKDT